MKSYETVIGLEVHAELATKTKIFCGCTTEFGGEPNTHCCPVCTGMPGTLPVLNKKVVEYEMCIRDSGETLGCGTGACAAVVASALNGYVKEETDVILAGGGLKVKWDRKRNEVILRGTAEYVFSGEVNVEQLKICEK